jgi:hypothetical protein
MRKIYAKILLIDIVYQKKLQQVIDESGRPCGDNFYDG